MYHRSSSKGIFGFLTFAVLAIAAVISVFLFTLFFKYHIYLYISSDASLSKSSLIPFSIIVSTYDGDSLSTRLSETYVGISDSNGLKYEINRIIFQYIQRSQQERLLCYEFLINGFEIENKQPNPLTGKRCEKYGFYQIKYPFPVVYDGQNFLKELEFKTFKFEG